MTDDIPDRRRNDEKLDLLIEKVDAIYVWQESHVERYHASLKPGEAAEKVAEHNAMMQQTKDNGDLLGKIVNLLEGEDILSELDPTHVVDRKPGLIYQLTELRRQSLNGGIRTKINIGPGMRAFLVSLVGLLTAIVVLLTAIFQSGGG